MSQNVVITISIALPDGARVAVSEAPPRERDNPPPQQVEDEPPFPGFEPVMAAARKEFGLVCPVHGQPWKTVQAGVSKSTGKAYDSFQACVERDCRERPHG